MEHSPFNSGLENGLRALALLSAIYPAAADLQRLLMFDYLLVHSADASGPPSLHPNTPLRNGELLVRRSLVEQGLLLLASRELVERRIGPDGVEYVATELAYPFLDRLSSVYIRELRLRAYWIDETFMPLNDRELRSFFNSHFEQWTTEFQAYERSGEII
jgi:hypothetical protein